MGSNVNRMFRIVNDDVDLGLVGIKHGVETVATCNILERCYIETKQPWPKYRAQGNTIF